MSKRFSLDDIDNLADTLDDDVLIDDDLQADDDLIGDEISASKSEVLENYTIHLPISNLLVQYEPRVFDPSDCIAHPFNQRALTDHNRLTLKERIASFKRIGQQEPVLIIMIDGIPNVIDGYGRLKTWLYCREDIPGKYDGAVLKANVIIQSELVTEMDVIELSKTANESELLSDWNKSVIYQNMLDAKSYPDLKTLCSGEGISYELWVKQIKLAALPHKYIKLFVKTAHIPKTFFRKVSAWEQVLSNDPKASKAFTRQLKSISEKVESFVNGRSDEPPYDQTKKTGVNEIINQLEELVPKPNNSKRLVKEKDIKFASKHVAYSGRKSRNNTYAIKFEKCSDEIFHKVMASISEITGAKKVDD